MSRVDNTIRAAVGITVVGLAGIAGAISYSHMAELAEAHGEHRWRAHMFPLSVDGIEIVASLVLLADKRAGRRSGFLPWAALIAGTAASFAANVAVGGSDWIGRAVSGWPAFALLVAVKLLFGLLEHPTHHGTSDVRPGLIPPTVPAGPDASGTVPATPTPVPDAGDERGTVPLGTDMRPDGGDDRDESDHHSATVSDKEADTGSRTSVVSTALDVSGLLSAARAARAALAASGKPLTREGLARQMRSAGHSASNARVSALLKILAADDEASTDGGSQAA